jgi:hypothetical protein
VLILFMVNSSDDSRQLHPCFLMVQRRIFHRDALASSAVPFTGSVKITQFSMSLPDVMDPFQSRFDKFRGRVNEDLPLAL